MSLLLPLALAAAAFADPIALRQAGPEDGAALVLGAPLVGLGLWREDWGVSLATRDLATLSLEGARRFQRDAGRSELQLSAGLGALWLEPGLSGHLGLTALRRALGPRLGWTGSLSLPFSLRLAGRAAPGPVEARLPVLLGNQLQVRLGRLWLGPSLELGVAFSPGRPASMAGHLGLGLAVPTRRAVASVQAQAGGLAGQGLGDRAADQGGAEDRQVVVVEEQLLAAAAAP